MKILRYQFRDKVLIEGSIKRNFWDMKTIKITINHTTFLQERSFLNSKVYIIILLLFIILSNIITKYYIMLSKFNIEYLKY